MQNLKLILFVEALAFFVYWALYLIFLLIGEELPPLKILLGLMLIVLVVMLLTIFIVVPLAEKFLM